MVPVRLDFNPYFLVDEMVILMQIKETLCIIYLSQYENYNEEKVSEYNHVLQTLMDL